MKILFLRIYSIYYIEPVQNNLIKKILKEKKFVFFKQMIILHNFDEIQKKQEYLDLIKKKSLKENKLIHDEEKFKKDKLLDKVTIQNIQLEKLEENLKIIKKNAFLQKKYEKNFLYNNSKNFIDNSEKSINYVLYYLFKNNIKNFRIFYKEFFLEKDNKKKKLKTQSIFQIKSLRNMEEEENNKKNIYNTFSKKRKKFKSTLILKNKNTRFRSTFHNNKINKNFLELEKKKYF